MTNRNNSSLQTLREIVHADPELQEQLFLLQSGDDFLAAVQQLAESHQLPLSAEEIRQAMHVGQKNWIEKRLP